MRKRELGIVLSLFMAVVLVMLSGCSSQKAVSDIQVSEYKLEKEKLNITDLCEYRDQYTKMLDGCLVMMECEEDEVLEETEEYTVKNTFYFESMEQPGEAKELFSLRTSMLRSWDVWKQEAEPRIGILFSSEDECVIEEYTFGGDLVYQQVYDNTEIGSLFFSDMKRIEDGTYIAISDNILCSFEKDGTIEITNHETDLYKLINRGNREIYAYHSTESGKNQLSRINENGTFDRDVDIEGSLLKSQDDMLFSVNESILYEIDIDSGKSNLCVDLQEYGAKMQDVVGVFGNESEIKLLLYSYKDGTLKLGVPVHKSEEEIIESQKKAGENLTEDGRQIITIYSPYGETGLYILGGTYIINQFNEESEKYYVELEYGSQETLQKDLIRENGPDLLLEYRCSEVQKYINNGYLEDLSPYLQETNQFSGLCQDVYDIFGDDGKLYSVPNSIEVYSLMIPDSLSEGKRKWTVDEFLQWVEKYPEMNIERQDILYYCLLGNMDAYVDYTNKEPLFNQKEFKNLLERIHNLPNKFVQTNEQADDSDLKKGAILYGPYVSSGSIKLYEYKSGEQWVYMGYPSDVGNSTLPLVRNVTLSMLMNSHCKDGAAEFIRYYLEYPEVEMDAEEKGGFSSSTAPYLCGTPYAVKELRERSMKNAAREFTLKEYFNGGQEGNYSFEVTKEEVDQYCGELFKQRKDGEISAGFRGFAMEEAEAYFNGNQSLEETCRIIQNKATNFLGEKME